MDLEEVRIKIAERYGDARASHITTLLMPMILSDFYKMLTSAKPNLPIKEEYHLDDNSSVIELMGYGVRPGQTPKVASVSIDHILIWRNQHLHDEE